MCEANHPQNQTTKKVKNHPPPKENKEKTVRTAEESTSD